MWIPEWSLGNRPLWKGTQWNQYSHLRYTLILYLATLPNTRKSRRLISFRFFSKFDEVLMEISADCFQWNTVLVKEIAYKTDRLSDRSEQTGVVNENLLRFLTVWLVQTL